MAAQLDERAEAVTEEAVRLGYGQDDGAGEAIRLEEIELLDVCSG